MNNRSLISSSKIRNLLLLIMFPFLILLLCCSHNGLNDSDQSVEELPDEVFDTMEYLNEFNSTWVVYEGTKKHKEILKNDPVLFEEINRSDLLEDGGLHLKNIDTVKSWIENDTIYVSHLFFTKSRCLDMLSYLRKGKGTAFLSAPEIVTANVVIEEGDTLIEELSCELMTIYELIFKLPENELTDINTLYYNRYYKSSIVIDLKQLRQNKR